MGSKINFELIRALAKRDLRIYFSNPSGYVFITLFIFLSAAAAFWQERFFLNNLANLDLLNGIFPFLLLFFVPALTMSVWAQERKEGTDELLLTLPATDLEVVLGKYLAVLGIYSVSLLLSLSHVLVLFWLGSPDLGLMFANYFGYWLIGGAFIAAGMLASLLTSNATIAFILGALLCGCFVFLDTAAGAVWAGLGDFLEPLGVFGYFGDFSRGVISFSGLLYFFSAMALFLYLNVLLIGRRHWPRQADGYPMWVHHAIRTAAIVLAVVSLNAIIGRASLRLDVTAEQLHSLSDQTDELLDQLPDDRPVFIQAFISPEVPEQYVQTRANLLGILQEIDSAAGSKVQLRIQDTELYSDQAREAREKFGITPRQIPNLASARASFSDVFLGVAFTSGSEEQVIPFFDRGLPAEYEVVRSIRVVSHTGRKKVGVLTTEAKVFGGLDFQTFRSSPAWSVVEELKKQYEVVQISAATPITEDLDGLLAPLPSTLPQGEMDNLLAFIQEGHPTLLLVDPLPMVNPGLSPSEQAGANTNPFMRQNQPPPQPKGNIRGLLSRLGVAWDTTRVIWDAYNPHPDLAHLPLEVIFVGAGNEGAQPFNPMNLASANLQELVFIYPGSLNSTEDVEFQFQPLVQTGPQSGGFPYQALVQKSFFGIQNIRQNLPRRPDSLEYILAAQVKSANWAPAEDDAAQASDSQGEEGEGGTNGASSADSDGPRSNVIVIADLDFISEQFFQIRQTGPANLNLDNVSFFLNCMDVLLEDESFIALRSRRVQHRTLERVEEQISQFTEQRIAEEQVAEADAERALAEAQGRLDEKVAQVSQRTDLDAQAKQFMARNLQEVENRRFEALKTNIEADKEAKVQSSKENMEAQIRRIQSRIRTFAVALPPIPIFALGVWIFIRRQQREKEGAAASRRLRG